MIVVPTLAKRHHAISCSAAKCRIDHTKRLTSLAIVKLSSDVTADDTSEDFSDFRA